MKNAYFIIIFASINIKYIIHLIKKGLFNDRYVYRIIDEFNYLYIIICTIIFR